MNKISLPPSRQLKDEATHKTVQELRQTLQQICDEPVLGGIHVDLVFTGAAAPMEVRHGLNRQPTGYVVVRRTADIAVYDAAGEGLWVQASGAGTVKLYVY